MVKSSGEISGKIDQETRFCITSLVMLAHLIGPAIRSHWAIENSLHWVMNMLLREDECRVRSYHEPANFATITHMAHNPLRKAPGKASMRSIRMAAGWDDHFLTSLATAKKFHPIPLAPTRAYPNSNTSQLATHGLRPVVAPLESLPGPTGIRHPR